MAYVPWQEWRSLYEVEKGFQCGTIFAELNLPFCWKGGSPR
ncbi:spore coat associated protein CotJA [bacterium 210928-DFI.3.100]|nr:spore coat associated protein CotJA [Dorea amylophila]MCB7081387.1 spore coat associated protein CotJA [bacterium 210928-DFI.3.100]